MYANATFRIVPLLLLAILAACGEVTGPPAADIAEVAIDPGSASLRTGDEIRLAAVVRDVSGGVIPDRQVFWSSENPSVATVAPDGTVTGLGAGTTRIAASTGGVGAVAEVTVLLRPVGTVLLSPDSLRLTAGAAGQFQATLMDDRGAAITGRAVNWSSSAPAVATVDGAGTVTGVRPGTAVVTAEVEGLTASRTVRVVPGGPAQLQVAGGDDQQARVGSELAEPLTVRALDAGGFPLPGVAVTWLVESGDGTVAPTVSETNGQGYAATRWRVGPRPGTHRAAASAAGVQPVAFTARVVGGPPATVTVQPKNAELGAIDDAVVLRATAVDSYGNPVADPPFAWVSLQPGVATVGSDGRVQARSNGTARIVVATQGVADTATIRVQQVVDRVTVAPRSATLPAPGSTVQLTATAADRNGHPIPSVGVSWTSLNPSIAIVNGTGRVTAVSPGTATIRASAGEKHDAATVVVGVPQPSAIRIVSGNNQSGTRGSTLPNPLVVQVTDQQMNPVPGATVTWSADRGGTISPAVVVTDQNGRASVQWTLGMPRAVQNATATLQANGATVTFEAEAL